MCLIISVMVVHTARTVIPGICAVNGGGGGPEPVSLKPAKSLRSVTNLAIS
jgi:hypothetical protein